MSSNLPYGRHWIDDSDINAVEDILRSDWLTTGPEVTNFERDFADAVGAEFAVALSSGTAALHAAVFAAGVGAGDEVIVPPLTFVATANCVRYQHGNVVFADVLPESLLLNPDKARTLATERCRAIIAVDYAGQPAHLGDLLAIARGRNALLIEDAAHSLGATYSGRPVGSIADLTTFSLHPVKHITTGEGGMVTTNDETLAARVRLFRNHGITTDHRERERLGSWAYDMVALGYNYRLSDFQCALGRSQLKRLPAWVTRRDAIATEYDRAFRDLPMTPISVQQDRTSSHHLYVVQLELDKLKCDRAEIYRVLRAAGLGVNVHYIPVHYHSYYRELGYERGICPEAERAYERLITLPLYPRMTDEDVSTVISITSRVISDCRR